MVTLLHKLLWRIEEDVREGQLGEKALQEAGFIVESCDGGLDGGIATPRECAAGVRINMGFAKIPVYHE